MQKLELLAPAKNLECGIEAINHGADAVYIGASRYGARAAASNSIDDIRELCQYAHQFDAKVYVTVNTIIYDEELEDTQALLSELNGIGVDAVLVQDMGLLNTTTLPLHASTQTDNRTVEKVRWLSSLGFKRVVLARELSIEEIRNIHDNVPGVELEVFVHGALCVSYSGQCYASQYCFGRSANRGECAQFCRMPFTLKDGDGNILEESIHLLSLKDMAQLDNLERLADAGAVSFKIEGRLKDVDYVKNITAAYSERLNEICRRNPERYQRSSMGRCTYTFTPNIDKSFNRGFTTYFADHDSTSVGRKQTNYVSFDTPKAIGEPVGTVKEIKGNSFNVASTAAFSNGDGLCYFNRERKLIGFRVNKAEGNRLYPLTMPKDLKPGIMLYRNLDHAFLSLLSKPSAERKIAVSMVLTVNTDSLQLNITDEAGNAVSSSVPYAYQLAKKPQEDNIRSQLTKLGGTIYTCSSLEIRSNAEQPFIQSSLLANLRRQTLAQKWIKVNGDTAGNTDEMGKKEVLAPYRLPYLYNASNSLSKDFYKQCGVESVTSFERATPANGSDRQGEEKLLMQCRYCLRAELGYCTKSGKPAPWKEPLSIMMSDGKHFKLRFNCKQCEMDILA